MINEIKGFLAEKLLVKRKLEDPELKAARERTCNNNMGLCFDGASCKQCKCLISVKAGSEVNLNIFTGEYEQTHCPLGKWPLRIDGQIMGSDIEIANYYRKKNGKSIINI